MYKIGTIPYLDPEEKERKRASKSHEVILSTFEGGWRIWGEPLGLTEPQVPKANPDLGEAIKEAKRFVSRNKGTCLRTPKRLGLHNLKVS